MFSKNPNQKIDNLTKQIPALGKIPYEDRLKVFKQTFKSGPYKIYLIAVLLGFILVFYFNLDNILEYNGLERGGIFARSAHFLKELGTSFFLPLMIVMLGLVIGRNFFVTKQVKDYLASKNNSKEDLHGK